MTLYLFNTKTRRKELFTPINPSNIKMYVCGPTVYDHPHIGNARAIIVYDILFRVLQNIYGQQNIVYVRNITDVDDKINQRAKNLNISIQQLTNSTIVDFMHVTNYLNCLSPTFEPRATEYIDVMIQIIERLISNGHAYISNNEVLFDVLSYSDYHKFAGRHDNQTVTAARDLTINYKRQPADFILWKPALSNDDNSAIFNSPWGPGRPGWHIECSAMSYHFLGTDFDIHGGGADLIFPHHTNEIAQSVCAFPKSNFANYWIHNGFLTVNGEKMSKSLDNFIIVKDLIDQNIDGNIIRYLLINTHYRKPLNYSQKALYDAGEYINYLQSALNDLVIDNRLDENIALDNIFVNYLLDDLNTHQALVYLHDLAKQLNKLLHDNDTRSTIQHKLHRHASFLGFKLQKSSQQNDITNKKIDEKWIDAQIKSRNLAKQAKNWQLADDIRARLAIDGIVLQDKADQTTTWSLKLPVR